MTDGQKIGAMLLGSAVLPWIIAAAAIIALVGTCGTAAVRTARNAALQQELDSLRRSKPGFDKAQAARRDTGVAEQRKATEAGSRGVQHEIRAKAHGLTADGAAALAERAATARDSAVLWRTAYNAERQRGDALDSALVAEREARAHDQAAAAQFRQASEEALQRIKDQQKALDDLEAAVKRGECRVLGLLKCPSRTMAFAGGIVLGGAAAVVLAGR